MAHPAIAGLQLAALSLPGRDAASDHDDFYDVHPLRPGRWGLAVGAMRLATPQDAWPLERPVALRAGPSQLMATRPGGIARTACSILRAVAYIEDRPSRVLTGLNRAVLTCPTPDPRVMCLTYAAVRLTSAGTLVRICAAGQQLPLVLRAGGSVVALGTPGTPLGLRSDPQLHDARLLLLRAGDSLVLVTENVTQATGAGSAPFGVGRLRQVLAGLSGASAARSVGAILREVRAFCGGQLEHETVALVVRVPEKSLGRAWARRCGRELAPLSSSLGRRARREPWWRGP